VRGDNILINKKRMMKIIRFFDSNFKFEILDVRGSVVKIEHTFYFKKEDVFYEQSSILSGSRVVG
jgi:hypothetical protein